MGRYKRTEVSVNGVKRKKKAPRKSDKRWGHRECPPETPEQKFRRLRACAMKMARRFGVREWHRDYLTEQEVEAIEEERHDLRPKQP